MGYTHYIYRPQVIEETAWLNIKIDTAKVLRFIEDLGIAIDGGIIDHESIYFNGSDEQAIGIWTTSETVKVPWPADNASLNIPNADPIAIKTAGNWFGGTLVTQRVAPIINGFGSGSYEPICFDRIYRDGGEVDARGLVFDCCKTAYRPYDLAVTAFYTIIKHHVPECIVSSDGEEQDWMDAMIICHNILGYELTSPLTK